VSEPHVDPAILEERRFGVIEAGLHRIEERFDIGIRGIQQRLDIMNGRVAALEKTEKSREIMEARVFGRQEAQLDTLITKASWGRLIGLISAVGVIAGTAAAMGMLLVRVMG